MNHQRARIAAALLTAVCGTTVAAQQGFEHSLPADTWVFVGIDDANEYAEDLRASAMGRLWNDPAMVPLQRYVGDKLAAFGAEAEAELGFNPLDFPGLIEGPFALALLESLDPDFEGPSFTIVMLADVGRNVDTVGDMVSVLLDKVVEESGGVRRASLIDGMEIDEILVQSEGSDPEVKLQSGFHGSVLVTMVTIGEAGRDDLALVIDGLEGEAGAVLADTPAFTGSLAANGDAAFRLYANLGRIARRIINEFADDEELGVISMLGVRDLGVLSSSGTMAAHESSFELELEWGGDGLVPSFLRLLCVPGSFDALRYVPADVYAAQAWRADFAGLFDLVVKTLLKFDAVKPADVVEFLAWSEEELGFNVRDELLELFTGEMVFVTQFVDPQEALMIPGMPAGEPMNIAVILGLEDGEAFATLTNDLVQSTAYHATRQREEFLGYEVFYVPFGFGISAHYAIVDDLAIVSGSGTMVRDLLRRVGSSDLPRLTDDPQFRAALADMPDGYGMLDWTDTAAEMASVVDAFKGMPDMFQSMGMESPPFFSWFAELPLPKDKELYARYFDRPTITTVTIDDEAIRMSSVGP